MDEKTVTPTPRPASPAGTYLAMLVILSAGSWLATAAVSILVGALRWATGFGYPRMWWLWSAPIWCGVVAFWTVVGFVTRRWWLAGIR